MQKYITTIILSALFVALTACGVISDSDRSAEEATADVQSRGYQTETVTFARDGKTIYGELLLPESSGPHPVVVIAHGFGGNLTQVSAYAEAFVENGIAAYAFDFIGGGRGSRSDGKMVEMSVLTEAADMNAVLDGLLAREDIDPENIFLLGGSQGGFVATYVAGTRPEDVKGLVALYPAYVLQDDAWQRTPDPNDIPETMNLMGSTIGRIYNEDAMSFDIYDLMDDYPREVLIIHGTNDNIAPISYSERAITVFPSAELVKIEGAGHGFYGANEAYSAQLAVNFVKDVLAGTAQTAETKKILVSDGTNEVVFLLNECSAAESLYAQLPLTVEVKNYSTNEKIFYPPAELDISNVSEGDGPFGTLAYFSPWGNVVMYYSECGSYPGLYLMGVAVDGAEQIEKLNGTISVRKVSK